MTSPENGGTHPALQFSMHFYPKQSSSGDYSGMWQGGKKRLAMYSCRVSD